MHTGTTGFRYQYEQMAVYILFSDRYCYIYCCSLQYEGQNNYSPRCGVNTRIPGAAGTDISKVEHLDSFRLEEYAKDMVDYFVARGYVRDFSIRAMPYDWRLAAGTVYAYSYGHSCGCECMSLH